MTFQNVKLHFQVINNACASQAVISILMNCHHPDLQLGEDLETLKEFSMQLDPSMRGLALSNSTTVRAAHNSMARQALFEFDPKVNAKVSIYLVPLLPPYNNKRRLNIDPVMNRL